MGWRVKRESGKVSGLSSASLSPRVPKRLTVQDGPEQRGMPGRLGCGMHEKVAAGLSAPLGCRSFNGLQMI